MRMATPVPQLTHNSKGGDSTSHKVLNISSQFNTDDIAMVRQRPSQPRTYGWLVNSGRAYTGSGEVDERKGWRQFWHIAGKAEGCLLWQQVPWPTSQLSTSGMEGQKGTQIVNRRCTHAYPQERSHSQVWQLERHCLAKCCGKDGCKDGTGKAAKPHWRGATRGFWRGCGCSDMIFTVWQVVEKSWEYKAKAYLSSLTWGRHMTPCLASNVGGSEEVRSPRPAGWDHTIFPPKHESPDPPRWHPAGRDRCRQWGETGMLHGTCTVQLVLVWVCGVMDNWTGGHGWSLT